MQVVHQVSTRREAHQVAERAQQAIIAQGVTAKNTSVQLVKDRVVALLLAQNAVVELTTQIQGRVAAEVVHLASIMTRRGVLLANIVLLVVTVPILE